VTAQRPFVDLTVAAAVRRRFDDAAVPFDLAPGQRLLQLHDACPLHRGDTRGRTFSVNLDVNVFQCFDKKCAQKSDVIDLWASVKGLSPREASLDLVRTFGLEPAPRIGTEKKNG